MNEGRAPYVSNMQTEDGLVRSHLFTLRIWQEELGNGRTEWRGQLKYLPTGETLYFHNWSQVQELVQHSVSGFSTT